MSDVTIQQNTAPATIPTEHPHIVRTPGVRGGRPYIKGAGISVRTIAVYHRMGETVENILAMYPILTPAMVHDAISYYYDHLDEIEAEIEANELDSVLEKHDAFVDEHGVIHFRNLKAR